MSATLEQWVTNGHDWFAQLNAAIEANDQHAIHEAAETVRDGLLSILNPGAGGGETNAGNAG